MVVQRFARWAVWIIRWETETEAVIGLARDHVQMDVEDRLARIFAIGQEKVDPGARWVVCFEHRGQALADGKKMRAGGRRQIRQANSMRFGNDQQMSWCYRREIEQREAEVVCVDHTSLGATFEDRAKHAAHNAIRRIVQPIVCTLVGTIL